MKFQKCCLNPWLWPWLCNTIKYPRSISLTPLFFSLHVKFQYNLRCYSAFLRGSSFPAQAVGLVITCILGCCHAKSAKTPEGSAAEDAVCLISLRLWNSAHSLSIASTTTSKAGVNIETLLMPGCYINCAKSRNTWQTKKWSWSTKWCLAAPQIMKKWEEGCQHLD